MGKGKLAKFADMRTFPNVFEPVLSFKDSEPFEKKGCWNSSFFQNGNPIVLELGCGRGEYTVGLARLCPERNFIGIDIKGARMWTGARDAYESELKNAAFLRTEIGLVDRCFAPGEVSEIWLTFPDPQMKKVTKRLTSTAFLERYRRIMKPDGIINLKTDSNFLYTYTTLLVDRNSLRSDIRINDLYASEIKDPALNIQTYYEQQWLQRGVSIKYLRFRLPHATPLSEPEIDIPLDDYRSYNRQKLGKQVVRLART